IPFIVVNRTPLTLPEIEKIDSVIIDSYAGGYRALEHLYRLGHDRIAVIAGSMKTSTAQERTRGGQQALKDLGLKPSSRYFYECDYSWKKASAAAKRLLELDPRPTAVFAHDDSMALAVREVILSENLRIPEDIALVGFDDIEFANLKGIELTTISQKKYEMGTVATQILVNKIENRTVNMVNKVVLEAGLIIRRTCGYQLTGYLR
ncbi:MAG: substrate-binding domain-containing protein, partial [Deltaproteobacteria bacterium]|nr:substrate-binding domain-containing protein [Deltaproteobacteria bacterium]